ncbi:MAG: AbrB/MazE/SpoVT family DNA-binding domain-containing protein [Limisphaerales bacterium]
MRVTDKGQVTIPSLMRKKHGLLPHAEIAFVDQPNGVLVTKAGKRTRGKRMLSQLMRGGVVKGRTSDWLKLTRGDA